MVAYSSLFHTMDTTYTLVMYWYRWYILDTWRCEWYKITKFYKSGTLAFQMIFNVHSSWYSRIKLCCPTAVTLNFCYLRISRLFNLVKSHYQAEIIDIMDIKFIKMWIISTISLGNDLWWSWDVVQFFRCLYCEIIWKTKFKTSVSWSFCW